MSRRSVVFATGEVYHVLNRSVGREDLFSDRVSLRKILEITDYYRYPQQIRLSKFRELPKEMKNAYFESYRKKTPLVEIYTFSFMPNHYHFLLKQLQENGITTCVANMQNSFAKYANLKRDRHGTLFGHSFKARRIETDEEVLHVSRYIHLNPVTAYLIEFKELVNYPWTSFPSYRNSIDDSFANTEFILGLAGSREEYLSFIANQVDYQRTLARIKHLLFE